MSKWWIERKITEEHGIFSTCSTKMANYLKIDGKEYSKSTQPTAAILCTREVYFPLKLIAWNYGYTTEDWTNKVDVLGKFNGLWIATMLWRHGVIKFDNCAGPQKRYWFARYVAPGHFQTTFDDKSGYGHVRLYPSNSSFFRLQWGGWYFAYATLPFGWKASAFLYQTIGMVVSDYMSSFGVQGEFYIDDRHVGQLRLPPRPLPPLFGFPVGWGDSVYRVLRVCILWLFHRAE